MCVINLQLIQLVIFYFSNQNLIAICKGQMSELNAVVIGVIIPTFCKVLDINATWNSSICKV